MNNKYEGQAPTLQELYPWATEQQLAEIEERLDRYIRFLIGLLESLEADPQRLNRYEEMVATARVQERLDARYPGFLPADMAFYRWRQL